MENLNKTMNKDLINIGLIIFTLGTYAILLTLRYTKYKDDKKYKDYFIKVYQDFVKYLLIEAGFIIIEIINTGNFQISLTLKRLAIVQTALIIYNFIKHGIRTRME